MLQNRTEESYDFIKKLENSKMVTARLIQNPENLGCPSKFENLKNDFRKSYNRLEVPLLLRIAEIKQRILGISSMVVYYYRIADNKYWVCKLSKTENCTDVVENWLEQKMNSLACEMVKCVSHIVKKRQFDWFGKGSENITCEDPLFTCSNIKCLDKSFICDGINDCGDNSDEVNCPMNYYYSKTNCSFERGSYPCDNRNCVLLSNVCNGNDDCGDNSDEENCPTHVLYTPKNCSLELGTYLCGNKNCVPLSQVCDGNDDCGDGTDEGGNCTAGCQEDCHPKGVCLRTPQSNDCVTACPKGLFETASGCQSNMEPDSSPVSQLLDMERLISRHTAAYILLKTRTISEMVLSFTTDCGNHRYSMLDKIMKIKK